MSKKITIAGRFVLFCLIASVLSGCVSLCKVSPIKTAVEGQTVTFAESKMPCKKVSDFQKAVELAVRSIYSPEFEPWLTAYIRDSLGTGPHVQAWENVNAKDVVTQMKRQLEGTFADTYGGIKGRWLNVVFGNIAYDGTQNGPIRLNRIPLKHRSPSDISNTIAHEVAHRIGLTHPHSNDDLRIAKLEPPYVIGNIIEKIANRQN